MGGIVQNKMFRANFQLVLFFFCKADLGYVDQASKHYAEVLAIFQKKKPRSLSLNCGTTEEIFAEGKNSGELQSPKSVPLAPGVTFNFEHGNILLTKTKTSEKELNGPGSPKILLPIVVVFSCREPGFQ